MARRRSKPEAGRFSFVHNGEIVSRATEGQIVNVAQGRAERTPGEITFTIKEWNDAAWIVRRTEEGAVLTYPA